MKDTIGGHFLLPLFNSIIEINFLYERESVAAVRTAMMAKPATNQGINNISFQQTSINHHQRKSRQGRTAGPNQITTSSITSYLWELRTEAESSVWPDWP